MTRPPSARPRSPTRSSRSSRPDMRVTIVGSGFVGQTTAMRVLEKGQAEVVLIDIVEGLPQGLALDIRESSPIEGFEPNVIGTKRDPDQAGRAPRGATP